MKNVLAIGGSNSSKSINKRLAVYVAGQVENATTQIGDLAELELPLYSIDVEEKQGIPENALKFDQLIANADGIVLSLAEHNRLPSAAFKSLLDWLSRMDRNVWKNKPMFLMATSNGSMGGESVLNVMKGLLPRFGAQIVVDFSLHNFTENFSDDGIRDTAKHQELLRKLQVFKEHL